MADLFSADADERKAGYYWVETIHSWHVRYWSQDRGAWFLDGKQYSDSDFINIKEKPLTSPINIREIKYNLDPMYDSLFDYLATEHNLILFESELKRIASLT